MPMLTEKSAPSVPLPEPEPVTVTDPWSSSVAAPHQLGQSRGGMSAPSPGPAAVPAEDPP